MDTFLQLNREKLRPVFIRLSLTSLGFVSIVLLIAYVTGNLPNGQLLLYILLTTGIVFPIFIMLLGYIVWLISRNARQRAFYNVPFNQIETIGFHKTYSGHNLKWSFTDELKKGHLNGFTLTMDLSKEKGHTLEFVAPTEWKKLDKTEYRRLTEKFQVHNIEFRIGSLVKQYDIKQSTLHTVSDIKQDLEYFTTLLREEGFIPKS